MIRSVPYLVTLALLALAFPLASAFDPSALQDFCVAVNDSSSGGMYILVVFSIISIHIISRFWIDLSIVRNILRNKIML